MRLGKNWIEMGGRPGRPFGVLRWDYGPCAIEHGPFVDDSATICL